MSRPAIYTSQAVRESIRKLQRAFYHPAIGQHRLAMTEREFLHVVAAIEHDRSKTRKAIGKGLADVQDLRATDSLWEKLQVLRAQRMKGAKP